MRTSYRMSHPDDSGSKEPTIEERLEKESDNLVDSVIEEDKQKRQRVFVKTYREIENAKYESSDKENASEAASQVKQEAKEKAQQKQEAQQEKKKKSRKKVWITLLSILGVLVIALGGLAVYNNFFRNDTSIEAISERVNTLYTSAKKEDIKNGITEGDLDKYYLDLNDAASKGADTSSLQSELDSIGYFLSDKVTLTEYDSEDYDLTTSGLQDSVNSIKENSESYTVPGLAVTISDLCSKINGDYETFIALRSEMQGITDATTFDEEGYKARIANIRHKPNQEELNAIYDNIVADKRTAEAEQALKDAATKEAQEQAQKALEEAQKAQQETQQKLEEAEKKLQEKANEVKEGASDLLNGVKDAITGNSDGESSEGTAETEGSADTQSETPTTENQ